MHGLKLTRIYSHTLILTYTHTCDVIECITIAGRVQILGHEKSKWSVCGLGLRDSVVGRFLAIKKYNTK